MADALGIASSVVAVVQASSNSISRLRNMLGHEQDYLVEIKPQINRFETAVALLQTTSKHLPTNAVPPGVHLSLQMCTERWGNIQQMVDEVGSGSKSKLRLSSSMNQFSKRLSKEVDLFADSVRSLTTFSQEYFKRARTEYILQSVNELMTMSRMSLKQYYDLLSQADRMNDGLNFMRDILEVLNDARAQNNDDTHVVELLSQLKADMDNTRGNIDKRQEDLKEIRAQLERTFTQQKPLEFSQSDEFVYNISILSREDGAHDAASSTHCRATLDTGCHDNWVSIGIIKRADLQDSIITITDSDKFESFSGHTMEPQGQIELTFFLATASGSSQQTRTEAFYVFDQLPVDLVLGKGFIAKQFTLVSKHALGLVRQGKFTQEEVRTIEISLKKQGAANAEISSLRRAVGSSAREARRAQKAASRAVTRGSNTPFSGASGWGTPRHPDSILRVDTRRSSLMVPTSGLHISSTQASEGSGPEDDDEVQEPDIEAGPSGTA